MKLKGFLTSQAIRFFSDEPESIGEMRSPIPLIRGLQDVYGFVQVPTTVADLDFAKGVSFLQGYYKGCLIDKLQIYHNGILCEAAVDNSLCDEFIGEVLNWAQTLHQIPVRESGVKAFLSQLELTSNIDLGKINPIGKQLADALKNYGQPVAPYRTSGIRMHYDSAETPAPRPPEFIFERRAGEPYSKSEYFSSAPLRTTDHLRVLDGLEKIYSGG